MSWGKRAPGAAILCIMAVTGVLSAASSPVSAATTASPAPAAADPCDSVFGGCTTSAILYAAPNCSASITVNWDDGTSNTYSLSNNQSLTVDHTYAEPGDYTVSDSGSAVPITSGVSCPFVPFSFVADLEPSVSAGSKTTVLGTDIVSLQGTASTAATGTTWSEVSGPPKATAKFAADSPATTVTVSAPGKYTFELTATNADGETATSQVTDTVLAYIALGDSYSAGPGAGENITGSALGDKDCYRYSESYPEDIDNYVGQPNPVAAGADNPAFVFAACSGATTAAIRQQEVYLHRAAAGTVGLVTLTAGGVDAYFGKVMYYCATRSSDDPSCQATWGKKVSNALASLGPKLATLYAQIKSEPSLAPGAAVLVFEYPRLFPTDQTTACPTGYLFSTFLPSDMAWMNAVTQQLDNIIDAEATAAGLTIVPAYNAFNGHEVCQAAPYDFAVKYSPMAASFHPNVLGHAVLAGLAIPYLPSFNS